MIPHNSNGWLNRICVELGRQTGKQKGHGRTWERLKDVPPLSQLTRARSNVFEFMVSREILVSAYL
jgi:hypothetical protein